MDRRLRRLWVSVLFCLGVGLASASTFRAVGSVLYINGCAVLRIAASAGGEGGDQRAEQVAEILGTMAKPGPISTRKEGDGALILAGASPCVTVTHADAVHNGTTADHLAAVWASRIRQALDLPELKLAAGSMEMPSGADRTVLIVGTKADSVSVSTSDDKVLTVRRSDDGAEIHSVSVGKASVVVRAGTISKTVDVVVRAWATDFPQKLSAEVVGSPTDGSTVRGAIETAMKSQLAGRPGVAFQYSLPDCGALTEGGTRKYEIPVRAVAPDSIANYGAVEVDVANVAIKAEPDAELWYSNNPEVLDHPRPLFSATLRPDVPARLLYHHINGTTQGLYLRIQIVNSSDQTARLVIMPGDSRPSANPVLAGLDAAAQYFRAWLMGSGEVVSIPAKSSLPVSLRYLSPGDTVSGLCGLRLLSGPKDLLVRTDALPPFTLDPAWKSAVASSTPWREVGCIPINAFDRAPYEISEHIYPDPHKTEEVAYSVGGRFGFLRIGQRAILRQDQASQLDGNFGVIYDIKAVVDNPTNEPTDVEIVFEASAGYSGGLFSVDGNLFRTPLLQAKDESRLVRFYLPPGAKKKLDISTLPLAGSSYPATLLIRPLPHLIARSMRTKKK